MAIIEIEALLQPLDGDSPCGEDCEYDPAFGELERSAQGTPEKRMGDTVIDAEPPDWREVASQATALFERTKDLRVAVLLARAATVVDGVAGLASGIALIQRLLAEYWDTLYPLLDEDDDNDPTLRMNSLLALNDRGGFLAELNQLPMVSERQLGTFRLRDIRIANGEIDPVNDEPRPDPSHIDGAFLGADLDQLQADAEQAQAARASLSDLMARRDGQVGSLGPNLEQLDATLRAVTTIFDAQLSRRGIGDGVSDETDAVAVAGAVVAAAPGEIRSRDDVVRALDRICDYFRQHEPSSPVPFLLERAKRLVTKDFVEILKDMTPSGVAEAMTIAGISEEEQGW